MTQTSPRGVEDGLTQVEFAREAQDLGVVGASG